MSSDDNIYFHKAKKLGDFESNFEVEEKLGEGTFSVVYRVRDKLTGKHYAAKNLFHRYPTIESTLECTELQTLVKLEYHPNVLSIINFVHDPNEGHLILILDLMDMSLYDFFKDRKKALSEKRCKNFLYQMALGLHHLHRSGIFHRDIKPENILIRQLRKNDTLHMELIQIADLGSVCAIDTKAKHTAYISTRWYRSPECLLTSGRYGAKMDIWALGCVFFELLTYQPLFPGNNELDQLQKIHEILGTPSGKMLEKFQQRQIGIVFTKKTGIPLHKLLPMTSSYGVDILRRTLSYHPDTRISSKQMIDHVYFHDLRNKYRNLSSTGRLLMSNTSTSLDAGLNFLGCCKASKPTSNLSTAVSQSSRNSSTQKSEAGDKVKFTVKKQLERGWGMNSCPKKSELMKKIKSPAVKFG